MRKNDGAINTPSTSWRATPFLKIDKQSDLQIRAYDGITDIYKNIAFCAFYDANYNFISAYDTGNTVNGYYEGVVPISSIPSNAEYIRCSCIGTNRLDCYVRPFDEYNILLDLQLKKSKNTDFK